MLSLLICYCIFLFLLSFTVPSLFFVFPPPLSPNCFLYSFLSLADIVFLSFCFPFHFSHFSRLSSIISLFYLLFSSFPIFLFFLPHFFLSFQHCLHLSLTSLFNLPLSSLLIYSTLHYQYFSLFPYFLNSIPPTKSFTSSLFFFSETIIFGAACGRNYRRLFLNLFFFIYTCSLDKIASPFLPHHEWSIL